MNVINSAIYSTLSGGTALTILLSGTTAVYNMQAPDNATFPYVVFNQQAGGPLNVNPSDMRDQLYYVRGYSQVSAAQAGSIDTQISNLLHHKNLTITGYTNFVTDRESDVSLVENRPDGSYCYSEGAIYRIRIDG